MERPGASLGPRKGIVGMPAAALRSAFLVNTLQPRLNRWGFFWWWATLAPALQPRSRSFRWGYPVNISIIIPDAFLRLPLHYRCWCYPARARDRSRDDASIFDCVTGRAVRSKGAGTTWRPFAGSSRVPRTRRVRYSRSPATCAAGRDSPAGFPGRPAGGLQRRLIATQPFSAMQPA
jgi:hypothetical protein